MSISNKLRIGKTPITASVRIAGSKSESNRILILQKQFSNIKIQNLSDSVDSQVLQEALSSESSTINIGHAGTAMRFLTAYFSTQEGQEVILSGSSRMHERPIKALVDALLSLGADISYLENEGYPPLKIKGKKISQDSVQIDGSMSSQYVSALMLVAPSLQHGLNLSFKGEITSRPYIEMTLQILQSIGVSCSFHEDIIQVKPLDKIEDTEFRVESDWSSASYLYSFFALSTMEELRLTQYKKDSLQGDSALIKLFESFGVESQWQGGDLVLRKTNTMATSITWDCSNFPDLAQTLMVTAFGLKIPMELSGLHTLKIKETDRILALQTELQKLGAEIAVTDASMSLTKREEPIKEHISIATYQDHRMAMAFASLSNLVPIEIENPEVVEKSFINFWEIFKELGVEF